MTSRYSASSRYELGPGGMTATRRPKLRDTYTQYMVKVGDTMDNLAHRHLGDHLRWWEIADMNPQLGVSGFVALEPGTVIRIPA